MDLVSNAYAAALILGALHSFEVDHMIAVSVFASSTGATSKAAAFGARWGIGHSSVVVAVGGALAWSNVSIPDALIPVGEASVGVAMLLLGAWAFRAARNFHVHRPPEHGDHGHLHSHSTPRRHHQHSHTRPSGHHRHLSTLMGAVHGLAGTAPLMALVPVTLLGDFETAIVYLVFFSIGTTLSMTLFAVAASMTARRVAMSEFGVRRLAYGIALATMAVGIWWIIRIMPGILE